MKPPRRLRLEFLWLLVLGLAVGLSWIPSRMVLVQSLALEGKALDRDVNRMVQGLRNEIHVLDGLARDWSDWDDTYRFVQDRNAGFAKANLSWESLLGSTRVQLVQMLDGAGRPVWGGFRTRLDHPVEIPSELPKFLVSGQSGVLLTREGPLMVSVRPILKSDGSGPSVGTLVMGRLLDDAVVRKLRRTESLEFQVRDTLRQPPGPEEAARMARLASGRYETELGPTTARVEALMPSLEGGGGLRLTLTSPREFYRQGRRAAWIVGGAIFLAFLTVGSALMLGLRWYHLAMTRDLESLQSLVEARTAELKDANRALEEASMVDALTGLRNRRFVDFSLPNDVARSVRIFRDADRRASGSSGVGEDMVFFLVDLDHFKQVNDLHGHLAGDVVLREVGALLRKVCRESDLVARWGGEEFLVVARRTNRDYAPVIAENLAGAFRGHAFRLENGLELQATCSIGYCPFPMIPEVPEAVPWARVMEMADLCLYAAKRSGRNGWVGVSAPVAGNPEALAARLPGGFLDLVQAGLLEVRTSFADPVKLTW